MATRLERKLKREKHQHTRNVLRIAGAVDVLERRLDAETQRRDALRNVFVATFFARGQGNELPLSEVVLEAAPQLVQGAVP